MILAKENFLPIYKRDNRVREVTESKIDMGLMPQFDQDDLDLSLLMAVRDRDLDAMRAMIDMGADVHVALKPQQGETICSLLHIAALGTDAKVVDLLVESGANPLRLDSNGLTPRDYAMKRWHNSRVKAALRRAEKAVTDPVNDDRPLDYSILVRA